MSLVNTWYTIDEAEGKFGVDKKELLEWVADGLVRSEVDQKQVLRLNGDDLELKLFERSERL